MKDSSAKRSEKHKSKWQDRRSDEIKRLTKILSWEMFANRPTDESEDRFKLMLAKGG